MKSATGLFLFLIATASLAVAGVEPGPPTWTLIQAGGAPSTVITGINNGGTMVGYYSNPTVHGLVVVGNRLITLEVPGADATYCNGINSAGAIVGSYTRPPGSGPSPRGFSYQDGKFTDIGPGTGPASALGINDTGLIVGSYAINNENHGFSWDGINYQTVDVPEAVATDATGINNDGLIALTWLDSPGKEHGSLYDGASFTTIDVPGAPNSFTGGINNFGDVAFEWRDERGRAHGALLHAGQYIKFMVPSSNYTGAFGVNDSDVVTGFAWFANKETVLGFRLTP